MNLLILHQKYAADFERFCRLNHKPCPLLEIIPTGSPISQLLAPGADIRTDIPRYRIYKKGKVSEEVTNIANYWQQDFVAFLLGCSFTFESALLNAGIPVRHLELNCNVPMFITNMDCHPSGPFKGKMAVSMRPMTINQAKQAFEITAQFPAVHGTPLCRIENNVDTLITDPTMLGIKDINKPDFGDPVPVHPDEVPVFWACGVTSQLSAMRAELEFFISHSPGHMFISDKKNEDFLEINL